LGIDTAKTHSHKQGMNFRDIRNFVPRFVPLQPAREGEPSGRTTIVCAVTGERRQWNVAVREGWCVDNRPPNHEWIHYLSPESRKAREALIPRTHNNDEKQTASTQT
jgi:hypothetical protein